MTFESFFLMLPGLAVIGVGLILLCWIIFYGIPKVQSMKYSNRAWKNQELTESRLDEATMILRDLAYKAEDDAVLEVQLGSKCLKNINQFLSDQPKQLGR